MSQSTILLMDHHLPVTQLGDVCAHFNKLSPHFFASWLDATKMPATRHHELIENLFLGTPFWHRQICAWNWSISIGSSADQLGCYVDGEEGLWPELVSSYAFTVVFFKNSIAMAMQLKWGYFLHTRIIHDAVLETAQFLKDSLSARTALVMGDTSTPAMILNDLEEGQDFNDALCNMQRKCGLGYSAFTAFKSDNDYLILR
jgi:hypothetical protein